MPRPKGKKNGTAVAAAVTIDDTAQACKQCGGSVETVTVFPSTAYCGEHDGKRYTMIERTRVRCGGCGAIAIDMRRTYDPKLWS